MIKLEKSECETKIIMKRGKRICKTLKEVRKQVAKANDIAYSPTVCHHEGDCAGTCPACEAEVRYLEQQLQLRRQLGKAVAVVGVSMGLVAMASCESKKAAPDSGSETVSVVSQTVDNKAAAAAGNSLAAAAAQSGCRHRPPCVGSD